MDLGNSKKKLFFKIISCLYFRFYGPKSAYEYDWHTPMKVFFFENGEK